MVQPPEKHSLSEILVFGAVVTIIIALCLFMAHSEGALDPIYHLLGYIVNKEV